MGGDSQAEGVRIPTGEADEGTGGLPGDAGSGMSIDASGGQYVGLHPDAVIPGRQHSVVLAVYLGLPHVWHTRSWNDMRNS